MANTYDELVVNTGATSLQVVELEAAAEGAKRRFYVNDTDGIKIQASSGDVIRIGATTGATAGYIQSVVIGSYIDLLAIDATNWIALSCIGTWVFDGTTTVYGSPTFDAESCRDTIGTALTNRANGGGISWEVSDSGDTIKGVARPACGLIETPQGRANNADDIALVSGTLRVMLAQGARVGDTITSLTVVSGATPANTPTHWMLGLVDGARNKLANTADQLTAAFADFTTKTVNLTAPYVLTAADVANGDVYICIFMVATTPISLAASTSVDAGTAPITSGTSDTGLTTSIPSTIAAITAHYKHAYARGQ